ncbi:MAG: hypothetical protein LCI02_25295, partial [Proteobacteria bacterium]|nr:hypothetical protein [Pseudomonadota bacterium]
MKDAVASVLRPEEHASLIHGSSESKVIIWTPGKEPHWRTRKASLAIDLLAAEASAEDVYFSVNQFHGRRPPRGRIVVAPIGLGSCGVEVFKDGGGRLWSLWSKAGAVGNATALSTA